MSAELPRRIANAAWSGRVKMVTAWLDQGGNVDARRDSPCGTSLGVTMLMVACSSGYFALIEALLQHGADVNLADSNGVTALMCAAENGRAQIVKRLLKAGAQPEAHHAHGHTAQQLAESQGHAECSRLLHEHAAALSTPLSSPVPDDEAEGLFGAQPAQSADLERRRAAKQQKKQRQRDQKRQQAGQRATVEQLGNVTSPDTSVDAVDDVLVTSGSTKVAAGTTEGLPAEHGTDMLVAEVTTSLETRPLLCGPSIAVPTSKPSELCPDVCERNAPAEAAGAGTRAEQIFANATEHGGPPAGAGEDDDEAAECVICRDAQNTHAFVPCGHQCVCATCSESVTGRGGNGLCPICRVPCFMAMPIFK